ncbi:Uncharacterised protein [Neisseria zoodegmatis]|uniref:Uncharacterized protein n=1 Tax=Neisseria zoodegmatis TaxID=326523 RepID=A0A378WIC2_9NEIS|nr:Uncharacterised protein [Neisseria zoodegmatis]
MEKINMVQSCFIGWTVLNQFLIMSFNIELLWFIKKEIVSILSKVECLSRLKIQPTTKKD